MARHESEREDLMVEAKALRERVEYSVDEQPETVVAGFRANGQWSLYFGSDPVYHFTADGALRRAFCGDDLYRTQGTTLARLRRVRTGDEVQLVRHDLTPDELADFTARMNEFLANLKRAIESGSAQLVRQFPDDADVESRLLAALPGAMQSHLAARVKRGA
jgi:hypothetical protein